MGQDLIQRLISKLMYVSLSTSILKLVSKWFLHLFLGGSFPLRRQAVCQDPEPPFYRGSGFLVSFFRALSLSLQVLPHSPHLGQGIFK